jgi:spore coat polysaccharide biosynthesis protein SpsF
MKIVGWIQARMGSNRLPGKVMKPLKGRPMIWHIGQRVAQVPGTNGIVLATTLDPKNDEMAAWATSEGWHVTRADREDDIAQRMALSVAETNADALLKVNADCPVVDVDILADLLSLYNADPKVDYVSNKHRFTFPLGMSAEIISAKATKWCDTNLTGEDREFAAKYIMDHPKIFPSRTLENDSDLSHMMLMVDTREDYVEMIDLFDALYDQDNLFGLNYILAHLENTK